MNYNDELRKEAEKMIQHDLSDEEFIARSGNITELIHELRVHQIELELQNEYLRETQLAQNIAEKKYFHLFQLAPVGYLILDEAGIVQDINLTACEMFDTERRYMIGKPLVNYFATDEHQQFFNYLKQIYNSKQRKEIRLRTRSDEIQYIHITTDIYPENDLWFCRMTIHDVTKETLLKQQEKQHRERYQAIFNYSNDPIIIFNEKLSFADANPAARSFLRYTRINQQDLHINHIMGQDWYSHKQNQIKQSGRDHGEISLDANGENFILKYRFMYNILPGYHMLMFSDVTQQMEHEQQLEASRELLEAIIDVYPAQIIVLDEQADIIRVNKSWREYGQKNNAPQHLIEGTGINYLAVCEQLIGKDKDTATAVTAIVRRMLQDNTYNDDNIDYFNNSIEDGRWYNVRFRRFRGGDDVRIVVAYTDITGQKQLEISIRNALEHERELSLMKSNFITTVSHEFRTPLATIQSSTDLLKRYDSRMSEGSKKEKIDRIQRSINVLTGLLEDVIELERRRSGTTGATAREIVIEEFFLTLVQDISSGFDSGDRINFQLDTRVERITIDTQPLTKIVTNLLSNALKYSKPADHVNFIVVVNDSEINMQIEDSGIGIPQEQQTNLFDDFFRAKNVGSVPGSGLGLSIVKHSVDYYGGTIQLLSQENMGTTFHVTLPVPEADEN